MYTLYPPRASMNKINKRARVGTLRTPEGAARRPFPFHGRTGMVTVAERNGKGWSPLAVVGEQPGKQMRGASVERTPRPVIPASRARVGMAEHVLDVAECCTLVERGSRCGVPQRVRAQLFGVRQSGGFGDPADHAERGRLVDAGAAAGDEERPGLVAAHRQPRVQGPPERRRDRQFPLLAALAGHADGAVSAVVSHRLQVETQGLTDTQTELGEHAEYGGIAEGVPVGGCART